MSLNQIRFITKYPCVPFCCLSCLLQCQLCAYTIAHIVVVATITSWYNLLTGATTAAGGEKHVTTKLPLFPFESATTGVTTGGNLIILPWHEVAALSDWILCTPLV